MQSECPSAPSGGGKKCFLCDSTEHMASECALQKDQPKKPESKSLVQAGPWVKRVVSSEPSGGRSSRMSVLITTSPVPSNPSTMMLEAVLNTFSRVEGLSECPLILVCDGYNLCDKSTWKAGRITEDAAKRYEEYLENLEKLLTSGHFPAGTQIVMLDGRNGQSLGVRAGLDQVETPHVLVHQHDLEFTFDFGLEKVLNVLDDEQNDVKYVGMPLLTNLHYEACAWQHHGVRVEAQVHGGLDLVPIVFWYDSTHITSVKHYKELVFGPGEVYQAGNFVEETFGVRQRNDIMASGMAAAHPRYGTYHCLSHSRDGNRRPLILHLNGVRFLTPLQRAERGFPAEVSVEFHPSRVMMNKKCRKIKTILDGILGYANFDKQLIVTVRNILSAEFNKTRIRGADSASACLKSRQLID